MLLHLPTDHTAEAVRDALTKTVLTLPAHLRRSLTWDQGKEMARHFQFTTATGDSDLGFMTIPEGTTQIQQLIIGRALTGVGAF